MGRMVSDQDSGFVLCQSLEAAQQTWSDGERNLEFVLEPAEVDGCIDFVCKLLSKTGKGADEPLEGLSFAGCNLVAADLQKLAIAVAKSLTLQALGVSKNPGIDSCAWQPLFEAVPETVTWLDFGDNQLSSEAIAPLIDALPGRADLDRLYLDGNKLVEISSLVSAVLDTSITQLDLGDNAITDATLEPLANALPRSVLLILVLGKNPLSAAAATSIIVQLGRASLDTLYLDHTGADDTCLTALGTVLKDSKLSEIHLDHTAITDAGVRSLLPHLPDSQLNFMDIGGNGITEATSSMLEAAVNAVREQEEGEAAKS